jgi:two-component system LytT family sensor kinase
MQRPSGISSKSFTIGIHIIIWLAFMLLPLVFIESEEGKIRFVQMGWFLLLLIAGYFYLNYFIFIPKLLFKKRVLLYVLSLIGGLAVIIILSESYFYFLETYINRRPHHHHFFGRFTFIPLTPALVAFAVSSSIKITTEWFITERQKKEMEAEKLFSELAFLKSQINPHFLFNILNNICSLARKKSDDTENAIIKLSQIMRYMLQDSKNEKVPLGKEIEYLQNYIELQRLRISDQVKIEFRTMGRTDMIMIEPLLLIPFVENAFKHGVSYLENSEINIFLKVEMNFLLFRVENNIVKPLKDMIMQESGIGLKNVVRRLELLYPGKHNLTISDNGEQYHVELNIQFFL